MGVVIFGNLKADHLAIIEKTCLIPVGFDVGFGSQTTAEEATHDQERDTTQGRHPAAAG